MAVKTLANVSWSGLPGVTPGGQRLWLSRITTNKDGRFIVRLLLSQSRRLATGS